MDSTNSDRGFPARSFESIDQMNAAELIGNLSWDCLSLEHHMAEEPAKTDADGDEDWPFTDILKKLAAIWNSPSPEPAKSPDHTRYPTAFIDLPWPDPSKRLPKASPGDSSRNTNQERPPTKEPNLKVHTGSQTGHSDQQRHHQHLKQLETHRPTKSVNQKQPAAERTAVLYDSEASHLQPISTLPADIDTKGCTLLIVQLSSPGMVEDQTQLYPAATRSNIYNALVPWFLSLVCRGSCFDEGEAGVPFWVAGLQQLWTEDGLALHVLAVPRRFYAQRIHADDRAPFHKHVCRFLSETSLARIPYKIASRVRLPYSSLETFISAISNEQVIDSTFALSPGFYWQTVETQECVCEGRAINQELHTEVSIALWGSALLQNPSVTHHTLQLVLDSGLDVCGLRLLYPPQEFLRDSAGPVIQRTNETSEPVLALAVRGPHAYSVLEDLTRSLEPLLPRQMPTASLNALHYGDPEPPHFTLPQSSTRVHRELCFWFSGRIQGGSAPNDTQPLKRDPPSAVTGCHLSFSRPPSFLCATTKADLFLVVSPVVPPRFYGHVLAVCERRGFSLRGLQRLQLQSGRAAILGLTHQQALVFCRPFTDEEELEPFSHSLVLLLRRENALHHSVALPAALVREFEAEKLVPFIHIGLDGVSTVEPCFCFHTVLYRSDLLIFVECMWAGPDPSAVIMSRAKRSLAEQVVILTLHGNDLSRGLGLLHRALTEGPEGFELLGLKFLPALTRFQAHTLSPYKVGEQLYYDSLDSLIPSPALVCALRRADAFATLRRLLPQDFPANLSVLLTADVAFRQASIFFFEHEMIPDPQMLLTVCLVKQSMWARSRDEIFHKVCLSGLTFGDLRLVTLDKRNAASFLPAESEPSDVEAHVENLCSGPSVALCLQGENAVRRFLDALGQQDSSLSTTSDGIAPSHNGIYASRSFKKAIENVKMMFPEALHCAETPHDETGADTQLALRPFRFHGPCGSGKDQDQMKGP